MKLITWNIQWCRGCDGRVDPARIVERARHLADFDVLCLQEVADGFPGLAGSSGENQFEWIASLLPEYQALEGIAVDVQGEHGRRARFGNMLLTRLPVLGVWRHLLAWPADPAVVGMQRIAIEAVLAAPDGPIRILTTHLEYYSKVQRTAQVRHLRDLHAQACAHSADPLVEKHRGSPFETRPRPTRALLCGDFNFLENSNDYALMQEPLSSAPTWRDTWTIVHPGVPHSHTNGVHDRIQWPTPHTCDFVFVSEEIGRAHV